MGLRIIVRVRAVPAEGSAQIKKKALEVGYKGQRNLHREVFLLLGDLLVTLSAKHEVITVDRRRKW